MNRSDHKQVGCGWAVFAVLFLFANTYHAAAAETGTIRIGLPLQVSSTLMIVALEKGYLTEEGVKATVKNYPSGGQALNGGLFAGEVDVITAAEVPIVFSSFKRNDFSVLASIGTIERYSKVVASLKSGIRRPADLKGKRLAVPKGTAVHFFLHLFLLKNHLSEKEIKLSFMNIDDLPEALASGKIDAFASTELSVKQAKAKLGSDALTVFEEQSLYAFISVLVASKRFIQENSVATKSILKALVRAEEFIKRHSEEAKAIVGKKINIPATELADSWNQSDFKVRLPQSLILAMEDEARWVRDSKLVEAKALPNYLDFIHADALKSVRPRSVGIIR